MSKDMRSNLKESGPYVAGADGALDPVAIAAIDRSVGIHVAERRVFVGLSQKQLAAKMGLSFQQVQKYEHGSNRISASRLHQLALILEVQVSYFFEDLPIDRRRVSILGMMRHPTASDKRTMETRELLSAFDALGTEAERRVFVRLLETMKNPGPGQQNSITPLRDGS